MQKTQNKFKISLSLIPETINNSLMLIRHYRADYIDKSGKVQASYSFQAGNKVKAAIEACNYKQKVLGCAYCKFKTVITLTGKVYPEPEPRRPRGRPRKHGINKFNR